MESCRRSFLFNKTDEFLIDQNFILLFLTDFGEKKKQSRHTRKLNLNLLYWRPHTHLSLSLSLVAFVRQQDDLDFKSQKRHTAVTANATKLEQIEKKLVAHIQISFPFVSPLLVWFSDYFKIIIRKLSTQDFRPVWGKLAGNFISSFNENDCEYRRLRIYLKTNVFRTTSTWRPRAMERDDLRSLTLVKSVVWANPVIRGWLWEAKEWWTKKKPRWSKW